MTENISVDGQNKILAVYSMASQLVAARISLGGIAETWNAEQIACLVKQQSDFLQKAINKSSCEQPVSDKANIMQARGSSVISSADKERLFHESSNGDRWLLVERSDSQVRFIRHLSNKFSGGHITDIDIENFLRISSGKPEAVALRLVLGQE